ncbi:PilN domain-containing protein [Burkholderiaceae bacterium FT117]|uniref:PilN domain-containing protein n=1 Tax=Zeimonas sediminis TaxID=2944268 RepID=UPI002342F208|nr:PilN domain-containing protein [Zeimonas sediminis]MCM5570874.1 PilN domain-containing protein [Zeimonas sediminis]
MNVRINLLPHREMRRERRKKDFVVLLGGTLVCAALAAFAVGMVIDGQIDAQRARNDFIRAENAKLDDQIKEIATLRAEIDSLRARQHAVETLQSNRTVPVHLVDELVRQMPEGAFLKSVKQDARKVTLVGLAQSNERISDLLRSLANDSPWLERPELVEIKAVPLGGPQAARGAARGKPGAAEDRRVFEFSVNALLRSPEAPAEASPAVAPGKARPAPARQAAGGTAIARK